MLPISDAGIAEFTGTTIKDVETLGLNADLEKVKRVTKPGRASLVTKRTSATVAVHSDVTEFDDSTRDIIVDHGGPVCRRNSRVTTPGKVASKEARVPVSRAVSVSASVACRAAADAVVADPRADSYDAISVEEEAAVHRVVLAARTAK